MKKLGEILQEQGQIAAEQLAAVLHDQHRTGEILGEVLLRLGLVTKEALTRALATQCNIAFLPLKDHQFDPDVIRLVPAGVAWKHQLIPIRLEGRTLTIALADVSNVKAVDEVRRLTKYNVDVVGASEEGIIWAIESNYLTPRPTTPPAPLPGGRNSAMPMSEPRVDQVTPANPRASLPRAEVGEERSSGLSTPSGLEGNATAVGIVEQLISSAIQQEASDIHIDPGPDRILTRFRVDGILQPGPTLPKDVQPSVVTRIKILGKMNISENRLPQDGRILHERGDVKTDLRVSVFPTIWGENVVIRVLDRARSFNLQHLGFDAETLQRFRRLIERPHGLLLVTGPTGSGKTTTLYAALRHINSVEKNIVTLEDPVEYELPMIRQCQINPKAGLTFASGLRSMLRHDPDVILVGEMRDPETVEVSFRSALTGHLVLSTLHTNSAVGAIPRIFDMGVEPFLVASTLSGVLAQRLLRVICAKCKEEDQAPTDLPERVFPDGLPAGQVFYRGKGCMSCRHTGFRGRTGLFELLTVDAKLARLIMKRADDGELLQAALDAGMRTMFADGIQKALAGVTTIEEVLRVAYDPT